MTENEIQLTIFAVRQYILANSFSNEDSFFASQKPTYESALTAIREATTVSVDSVEVLKRLKEQDYAAERLKHPCSRCGFPMVKRTNKNTGKQFWGCEKYPICKPESKKRLYAWSSDEDWYSEDWNDCHWFEEF